MISLKEQLYPLLNQDESLREVVKERAIREFFEGDKGRKWFFDMSLPMLATAATEFVQDVLQKDLDYEFSNIVKRYYDEDIQVLEFLWDRCAKLYIEDSSRLLIDIAMGKKINNHSREITKKTTL